MEHECIYCGLSCDCGENTTEDCMGCYGCIDWYGEDDDDNTSW